MESGKLNLASFGEAERFRKFYRLLCDTIGIKLALIELEGKSYATLDHNRDNAPLCSLMQRKGEFSSLCRKCDRENSARAQAEGHGLLYRCHAGLYDLIVPIAIDGKPRYAFIGGQILPEAPTEKSFASFTRKVRRFKFDQAHLREAYFKMPSLPPERLRKMLELIEFFAEHFQELGPRLFEAPQEESGVPAKALDFIATHFREPISLKSVAETLDISASHLCSSFKRSTGEGFTKHLRQLRTAEAAKLLRETNLRLDKVARRSGFSSVRSFNRCFMLTYGRSPRTYRKSNSLNSSRKKTIGE